MDHSGVTSPGARFNSRCLLLAPSDITDFVLKNMVSPGSTFITAKEHNCVLIQVTGVIVSLSWQTAFLTDNLPLVQIDVVLVELGVRNATRLDASHEVGNAVIHRSGVMSQRSRVVLATLERDSHPVGCQGFDL